MHARLLLPAFFSLCLVVYVSGAQLRAGATLFLVVSIVLWSVICIGVLRFTTGPSKTDGLISDTRGRWIIATHQAHPIDVTDYERSFIWTKAGLTYRKLGSSGPPRILVITIPINLLPADSLRPARSPVPFRLAVNPSAIGVIG